MLYGYDSESSSTAKLLDVPLDTVKSWVAHFSIFQWFSHMHRKLIMRPLNVNYLIRFFNCSTIPMMPMQVKRCDSCRNDAFEPTFINHFIATKTQKTPRISHFQA